MMRLVVAAWLTQAVAAAAPPLFWMHVPKTGSFFAETVRRVGCSAYYGAVHDGAKAPGPEPTIKVWPRYCDWALGGGSHGHTAYDPKRHANGSAITLLRDPRSRLTSAWYFVRSGAPMLPAGHFLQGANATRRAAFKASMSDGIATYATSRGIASCMTKMVLGKACGADVDLTAADLREAIRRVREDFLFLGIQGHFRASVQLAHKMLAPGLAPDESKQVDGSAAHHGYSKRQQDVAMRNLSSWVDAFDQPLYEAALALFEERCAAHGVALDDNAHQSWRRDAPPTPAERAAGLDRANAHAYKRARTEMREMIKRNATRSGKGAAWTRFKGPGFAPKNGEEQHNPHLHASQGVALRHHPHAEAT